MADAPERNQTLTHSEQERCGSYYQREQPKNKSQLRILLRLDAAAFVLIRQGSWA